MANHQQKKILLSVIRSIYELPAFPLLFDSQILLAPSRQTMNFKIVLITVFFLVILVVPLTESKPCANSSAEVYKRSDSITLYDVKSIKKSWLLVKYRMPWRYAMDYCQDWEMELIDLQSTTDHLELKRYFLETSTTNWQIWTSKVEDNCFDLYTWPHRREYYRDIEEEIPECEGSCAETRLSRLENGEAQMKSYNVPCNLEKWFICETDTRNSC